MKRVVQKVQAIKKSIRGLTAKQGRRFLYKTVKKYIDNTTFLTFFKPSRPLQRYDYDYLVPGCSNYVHSRNDTLVQGYVVKLAGNLVGLKKFSEGLYKSRRKLAGFSVTNLGMLPINLAEIVHKHYNVSIDGLKDYDENKNASKWLRDGQLSNIEACLYKHDSYYDFSTEVEVAQERGGEQRVLSSQEIREHFFMFRRRTFATEVFSLVSGILLVGVMFAARMVDMLLPVFLTFAAGCITLIILNDYANDAKETARLATAERAKDRKDPREMLRTLEACLRVKRHSYFICGDTKKEIKYDEKLVRQLRKLFLLKDLLMQEDSPETRANIDSLLTKKNKEMKLVQLYMDQVSVDPKVRRPGVDIAAIIKGLDEGKILNGVFNNLADKYSTTQLVIKEIVYYLYQLYPSTVPFYLLGAVFNFYIWALPTATIFTAVTLPYLYIAVLKPLSGHAVDTMFEMTYDLTKAYPVLDVLLRYMMAGTDIHKLDCENKSPLHKGCLDLMHITDSTDVFAHTPELLDNVVSDTLLEHKVAEERERVRRQEVREELEATGHAEYLDLKVDKDKLYGHYTAHAISQGGTISRVALREFLNTNADKAAIILSLTEDHGDVDFEALTLAQKIAMINFNLYLARLEMERDGQGQSQALQRAVVEYMQRDALLKQVAPIMKMNQTTNDTARLEAALNCLTATDTAFMVKVDDPEGVAEVVKVVMQNPEMDEVHVNIGQLYRGRAVDGNIVVNFLALINQAVQASPTHKKICLSQNGEHKVVINSRDFDAFYQFACLQDLNAQTLYTLYTAHGVQLADAARGLLPR